MLRPLVGSDNYLVILKATQIPNTAPSELKMMDEKEK
jgi:hypothetical protein